MLVILGIDPSLMVRLYLKLIWDGLHIQIISIGILLRFNGAFGHKIYNVHQ